MMKYERLLTGICPDCQGNGFFAGPRGGLSQNIMCQNQDCRAEFLVTPQIRHAARNGRATPVRYELFKEKYPFSWQPGN